MNIVILDAFTANPGDLSWDGIAALGNLTVYERSAPDEIITRCAGAEIILSNKVAINAEHMAALPDLKYIGVTATGTNVIDLAAAAQHGIIVTNIPAYGIQSVAQHVFALILQLSNQVALHDQAVHQGEWCSSDDFCFTKAPLHELDGLTLGIIGPGAIGQAVAKLGQAFGMQIIAYSRSNKNIPGISMCPLEEVFAQSDVLSLHCPLSDSTAGIINTENLSRMKSSAFLINTGRGPLINEEDLANSLNSGKIAAAGLDVLSTEPPSSDNPLLQAKNCIITPHIAWATQAARQRMIHIAENNITAFINNENLNRVSA
ncbi:MAG: D-2-hydroxyacid dehydrogenase [Planctomycetes bacterium]|nr:D-2-hydroxyacid dehydrogenase [Planctomycetota bacterium]